jgi:hypothetical protein
MLSKWWRKMNPSIEAFGSDSRLAKMDLAPRLISLVVVMTMVLSLPFFDVYVDTQSIPKFAVVEFERDCDIVVTKMLKAHKIGKFNVYTYSYGLMVHSDSHTKVFIILSKLWDPPGFAKGRGVLCHL